MGIYVLFRGIYAYFPGKYAHMFGFKMHKVQKMPKVVQLRPCGEKPAQKAEISQISIYSCFFKDTGILYHMI